MKNINNSKNKDLITNIRRFSHFKKRDFKYWIKINFTKNTDK